MHLSMSIDANEAEKCLGWRLSKQGEIGNLCKFIIRLEDMVINAEEFIILLDHAAGRRGPPRQDAADVNVFPLLLLHKQSNASESLSFVCVRESVCNMSTRECKAHKLCYLEM